MVDLFLLELCSAPLSPGQKKMQQVFFFWIYFFLYLYVTFTLFTQTHTLGMRTRNDAHDEGVWGREKGGGEGGGL